MITEDGQALLADMILGEDTFPTSLWVGLCLGYPISATNYNEPVAGDYVRQEIPMDVAKWTVTGGEMVYEEWIEWDPPAVDWGAEDSTLGWYILCDSATPGAGKILFTETIAGVFPGAGTPLVIPPYGVKVLVS